MENYKHPPQYPSFGDTSYPASWQGVYFTLWHERAFQQWRLDVGLRREDVPDLGRQHKTAQVALHEEAARLYASPQSEKRRAKFIRDGEQSLAYIYTPISEPASPPANYVKCVAWLADWDTAAAKAAPFGELFDCLVADAADALAWRTHPSACIFNEEMPQSIHSV